MMFDMHGWLTKNPAMDIALYVTAHPTKKSAGRALLPASSTVCLKTHAQLHGKFFESTKLDFFSVTCNG